MTIEPGFEHFAQDEAQEKVSRWVRTAVAFPGVPKGTVGQVVQVAMVGYDQGQAMYDVGIQWDIVWPRVVVEVTVPAGELYDNGHRRCPLIDWFNKGEYERYLLEVKEE